MKKVYYTKCKTLLLSSTCNKCEIENKQNLKKKNKLKY